MQTRPTPTSATRPRSPPRDRHEHTLLGLPRRDALLVVVVVLTLVTTIVAFAATTLGATDRRSLDTGYTFVAPASDYLGAPALLPPLPRIDPSEPSEPWRTHP